MAQTIVTFSSGGFRYEAECDVAPYRRAVTNPDAPGFGPAEGGLEGVSAVYLLDAKGNRIELPDFLQEELDELAAAGKFDDAIVAELADAEQNAKYDRAEAEMDRRREEGL